MKGKDPLAELFEKMARPGTMRGAKTRASNHYGWKPNTGELLLFILANDCEEILKEAGYEVYVSNHREFLIKPIAKCI